MAAQKLSLLEKLYAEKEFVDVKILCDEKTFECHKNVLSCQSEVFKTMIMNKSLNEEKTGIMEIEENDISSDIMEELLYYLYHDKVDDVKKINLDLLVAADKYMVSGLLGECVKYFKSNLSDQNALDVLVTAEVTNQKDLFEAASRFVGKKNLGSLNKSSTFREMAKYNPTMFTRVFSKMKDVQKELESVVKDESSSEDSSSDDLYFNPHEPPTQHLQYFRCRGCPFVTDDSSAMLSHNLHAHNSQVGWRVYNSGLQN